VRERVATALATAARVAVGDTPPTDLLVTGGAVAAATLAALDVRALDLAGTALDTGVPVGRLVGGPLDGRAVVTKAGAFGPPALLAGWVDPGGGTRK
jgi:uncharacterized protein YgbK (DUF1537 family)